MSDPATNDQAPHERSGGPAAAGTVDDAEHSAVSGAGREELRAVPSPRSVRGEDDVRLPVKMLSDRVLVRMQSDGERRSSGGILIPATAQQSRRLAWAEVVATGPNVRAMEAGDRVLFDPEDRYEVEVRGEDYIILRERDVHAVAAPRIDDPTPGLYL